MDRASIQSLYERYGYAVHRRCLRILGSAAEADDAVQEVFIRVIKYGANRRVDSPLPWLYSIASRVCFDHLDRRRRYPGPNEVDRAMAAEQASAGRHVTPEDIRAIAQVLEACDDTVREVAVLYHFDQLTQEEVAAHVGVSRKTVKLRLAKFMAAARKKLGVAPDRIKETL